MTSAFAYPDNERTECIRLIPPETRHMLDVGCSKGAFGAAVKRERPPMKVWGIEPNAAAAKIASGRLDQVVHGTFPAGLRSEAFDAITMLDVLEHMEDPWSMLALAGEMLAPGGVVVASIPNVRHYSVSLALVLHGRWGSHDQGILDRTHLRFFTKATMQQLFVEAGYKISRMEPLLRSAPPPGRSKQGLAIRLLPRDAREELLTTQYGIVATRCNRTT